MKQASSPVSDGSSLSVLPRGESTSRPALPPYACLHPERQQAVPTRPPAQRRPKAEKTESTHSPLPTLGNRTKRRLTLYLIPKPFADGVQEGKIALTQFRNLREKAPRSDEKRRQKAVQDTTLIVQDERVYSRDPDRLFLP